MKGNKSETETKEPASLFVEICDILETDKGEDESNEEFKCRAVEEFSDMENWPDERYDALPKPVQAWIYEATEEYRANRDRKRKRNLPVLPGLDGAARRGRLDINAPKTTKERAKKREPGSDCLTRTMRLLHSTPDLTAAEVVANLNEKYGKEYSVAAVRYAMSAFNTAKEVILSDDEAAEDKAA